MPTGVGGEDASLAIRHFAQRPAPLWCHANRVVPLLGEVRAVDNDHAIGFPQGLLDEFPMLTEQGVILPQALPDELLHRLDIATLQGQRHGLDRLARQGQQEPLPILEAPVGLLFAVVAVGKRGMIRYQVIRQGCNVRGRQVEHRW